MIQYNLGTVKSVDLIKGENNQEIWNFTVMDSEGNSIQMNSFVRRFPDPIWDENGVSEVKFIPSGEFSDGLTSLDNVPHLIVTLNKRDVPSALSDAQVFGNKPVKFYLIEK